MPYEVSDHFDGSRFYNPWMKVTKGFFEAAKWMLTSEKTEWPEHVDVKPRESQVFGPDQVSTTYINHATHLVQMGGLNFLTDPVFSERVSPVSWAGPKRVHRPGIEFEQLPPIHFVVISHNHYDHMDADSIRRLSESHNPLFVVPIGNRPTLEGMGAQRVLELDWWQTHAMENSGLIVTLVPAQHWSARSLFDRNKALWGGYVVQLQNFKVYFAGDTGYGAFFSEIRARLGPMSLSILPIGAYEPRWFMKEQHMNPEEAVQAHLDLGSDLSIGTHFGTFQLTDEGIDEPRIALANALAQKSIPASKFIAPLPSEQHLLPLSK